MSSTGQNLLFKADHPHGGHRKPLIIKNKNDSKYKLEGHLCLVTFARWRGGDYSDMYSL